MCSCSNEPRRHHASDMLFEAISLGCQTPDFSRRTVLETLGPFDVLTSEMSFLRLGGLLQSDP